MKNSAKCTIKIQIIALCKGRNEMLNKKSPIGVLDTGVGGLTVVKEIQRLMPNEDIIYIGDSINCPYGNKSIAEIKNLTEKMLEFLDENHVKVAAVACNTISSALELYDFKYDFEIKGIVYPAVQYIKNKNIKNVGVFATSFTVGTGCYKDLLGRASNNIKVFSKSSPSLAAIIESGGFDSAEAEKEITEKISGILSECNSVHDIILACTHYPIIMDVFKKCFPNIDFINPAFEQAVFLKKYLEQNNALNDSEKSVSKIYTTGNIDIVNKVCKKIGVRADAQIMKTML